MLLKVVFVSTIVFKSEDTPILFVFSVVRGDLTHI